VTLGNVAAAARSEPLRVIHITPNFTPLGALIPAQHLAAQDEQLDRPCSHKAAELLREQIADPELT